MTIDAIIPAYNEERTVAGVVRAARADARIRYVFVVDDGSKDQTAQRATETGAVVVQQKRRQGKGQALRAGVRASDADIFLFLDADLFRLTPAHIARLLDPVTDGTRAMNVGLRDYGMFYPLVERLLLLSGQRALRRDVFEAVPARLMRGYGVEIALNAACRYGRLPWGKTRLPGLAVRRKFDKVGHLRALVQYTGMWRQVLASLWRTHTAHARGEF